MSQPPPYDRQFNFQNQALLTPNDPPPADEMDSEFNAIKLTLDQTLANLALIQRDDGAVANNSIGFDQLKDEVDTELQPVLDAKNESLAARDDAVAAKNLAQTAATEALASENAAELAETNAELAQTAAEVAQSLAEVARDGAQSAQVAAEAEAVSLSGTSTTSNTIGTGSKPFTTQSGRNFEPGAWLTITSDANPASDYMLGVSTAYSGTALTVDVQKIGGSGAHTDWSINVSGKPGADGTGTVVADGDYGDIVVSGTGTVYTIDAGVVDTSKLGGDITTAGKAILDDASASAQRTTLGVGTGDSPEFTAVNVGHASDTTITRVSAGKIAIEGANLLKTNASETLTAGFLTTSNNLGTITGANQTITPDAASGQHQHCTLNGSSLTGTLTINPPSASTQVVLEVTNGGSGAVAATLAVGTTKTDGTWVSTNGSKFLFILTKTQSYSHCQIVSLQ